MIAVSFSDVSCHFGDVKAVDAVDLDILQGEFFAMLGPSGSGKTTCLRLIGGFEQPSAGHIAILGDQMDGVPPYWRKVNTVFQDYALFPHLNVIDNVSYGLKIRGVKKSECHQRARDSLDLVKLSGYETRRTAELSGGQRQRVALARALVNEPRVLLLDEPLGALDLQLREQMQEELKSLQKTLGITFVFVTHDQGEALSMADRVAIFNNGKVVQTGTPEEIYQHPESRFVANFVGSSNVLPVDYLGLDSPDKPWASLRPEAVRIVEHGGRECTVVSLSYLGSASRVILDDDGVQLTALVGFGGTELPELGQSVQVAWRPEDVHLMRAEA